MLPTSRWKKSTARPACWDGPSLTLAQLQRLITSFNQTDNPLAELAVALLAARRLGEVSLQSAHGRLFFRGDEVVVDEIAGETNSLSLRRK